MKTVVAPVALGLALVAGPVFAQAQAPAPAAPAPTQAQPAQAQAAPVPAPVFPQGAKVGIINIQRIANESAEGKASTARVKALYDKKVAESSDRQKALAAAQQKLQQGGGVLSDQARGQLEKEVERLQVELQRFTEDGQKEVQGLTQELQNDFQRKLFPIINAVAAEMSLHLVFSFNPMESGIVWFEPSLDLTTEVIRRFDAATAKAPAK
jgi:outer membrane protein